MEDTKKIETLEEELKLLKGELKQSIASVRDYLLNMELPSSEFATVIAALGGGGGDGEQRITIKGNFSAPPDTGHGRPAQEEQTTEEEEVLEPESELSPEEEEAFEPESELSPGEEAFESASGLSPREEAFEPASGLSPGEEAFEPESALSPGEEAFEPESALFPEGELTDQDEYLGLTPELLSEEEPDEQEESLMPESELPVEEEPMEYGNINAEVSQSIPKVNLLANIVQWVAKAKREIGKEQLSTFLEVYGISGHLSPELKEVILHLADITSEQPAAANAAEVWGQSMLSLHGILTGGDAPLHPVKPFWDDGDNEIQPSEAEIIEVEAAKPKDIPVKLKLVFPNGDGKSKEFCIDLNSEMEDNGS